MHAETPAALIESLNELIQLDYDAVKAYEQACEHVDDPEILDVLESFLFDHERHINDLIQLVRELHGTPIELGRDFKGVLLESFTAMRSVTGTLGALKAMRTNEKLTNRTYDKMLALELPAHVRAVVAVNRADERRHLATIEMHVERLSHAALDAEAERADRPHVRL